MTAPSMDVGPGLRKLANGNCYIAKIYQESSILTMQQVFFHNNNTQFLTRPMSTVRLSNPCLLMQKDLLVMNLGLMSVVAKKTTQYRECVTH
jgi:hypothetical protein